jgi:hypothetical protein
MSNPEIPGRAPRGKPTLWDRLLNPRHLAFWTLVASIFTVASFVVAVIPNLTSGNSSPPNPPNAPATGSASPSPPQQSLTPSVSASASPSASGTPSNPSTPPEPHRSPSNGPSFTVLYPTSDKPMPMCVVAHGTGPRPPFGFSQWTTHQETDAEHNPKGVHFGATITIWANDEWTTGTPVKFGEPGYNGTILAVWVWLVPNAVAEQWRNGYMSNPNYTVDDPAAHGARPLTRTPVLVQREQSPPGPC